MRGWIVVLGMLACGEEPVPLETVQGLTAGAEAPSVVLDLEGGQTLVTPVVLTGQVADPDQSPTLLPIQLTSDVDGTLWQGNAGAGGAFTWEGSLSPGVQLLTASTTDREGNIVQDRAEVLVRTNEAPACGIIEPSDGARFAARAPIDFRALATDPDGDPVQLTWQSSLSGGMFLGTGREWRFTRPGEHVIRLEGEDPFDGGCADEIRIVVE